MLGLILGLNRFNRVKYRVSLERKLERLCLLSSITYNQRADYNVCPYFYEREVNIMEITGIALQTVAAGEDIAFTETPVCGSKCIVHRQGSGIVKLRGITNQCKARFLVSYSGNIQIPTGGTVEAISLALAVDGEPLQSTRMIVTPAAVENFFNVSAQAYVDVPCGCCSTVAVQNTSTQAIEVQSSNLIAVREA